MWRRRWGRTDMEGRRKHGQTDICGGKQVSYKKMDGKEEMNPPRSSKETGKSSLSGSSEPTAIFKMSKKGCLQSRVFPGTGRTLVSESSRQGAVPL